jgi:phage-related protein
MSTPTNTVTELQKPNPSEIIELFEIHLDQRLHYADWSVRRGGDAGTYDVGDTVSSSSLIFESNTTNLIPPTTLVFECTAATGNKYTGTSQPNFPNTNGATVTDNNITWTAKRAVKRFHAGTNLKTTSTLHEASIHFGGKVYEPFPVQTEGFDMSSKGTLPRPRLTISNLSPSLSNTFTVANGGSALPSGTISAMMLEVNKITVGNDLIGSTLVRIRTLRKFLDSANFNSTNATENDTQKFPDEVYMIARKVLENQELVQFECTMPNDGANVRLPKRQILPSEFPGIGEFFQ